VTAVPIRVWVGLSTREVSTSVKDVLERGGPRKLLALDGGGIRGLITVEVLAEIEDQLRGDRGGEFRLADESGAEVGPARGTGRWLERSGCFAMSDAVFRAYGCPPDRPSVPCGAAAPPAGHRARLARRRPADQAGLPRRRSAASAPRAQSQLVPVLSAIGASIRAYGQDQQARRRSRLRRATRGMRPPPTLAYASHSSAALSHAQPANACTTPVV
jgi:hypothetical protein